MPKTDHRKNLTPTMISGLKPAAKGQRYQIMDAQVPGLGVRVTDKGTKTFILRIRYPGSATAARREIGRLNAHTRARSPGGENKGAWSALSAPLDHPPRTFMCNPLRSRLPCERFPSALP